MSALSTSLSTGKLGLKRAKSNSKISSVGQPQNNQVTLEKVLGISVSSGASLSCDSNTGLVAYPAGCTVVLYNGRKNTQRHLISSARKTILCLSFSPDGKYLAVGEFGHEPAVRVWDVEDGRQIAELKGHKHGICCVAFSPQSKYLVSVGNEYDQTVNVWNWRNQTKVASNKISSKVRAISFAESGQYFVTVGVRHVKFWYLEKTRPSPVARYKENGPVPIQGRSGILADQRNNLFCDVVCGQGSASDKTYCLTQKGVLCEFNSRRSLARWVDLNTESSNSIAHGNGFLFIGCAEGFTHVFEAQSLQHVMTMPRPHILGVDVAAGLSPQHMVDAPSGARYPDTLAVVYDRNSKRLTCVYKDRSLYQWEINDKNRIGKAQSHLFHAGTIWGVEMVPDGCLSPPERGDQGPEEPCLPPGTFLTCGADETIRIWNCGTEAVDRGNSDPSRYGAAPSRNIYSQELLKVLYLGQDTSSLIEPEASTANISEKGDGGEEKRGVRSIKISPDGHHLAAGSRSGNVRVYDMQNFQVLLDQEAHDADVLCLEYSDHCSAPPYLMASSSRDRLLHVFDVWNDYQPVATMDDHQSSIPSVKFVRKGAGLQMLSCGSDKSIIFRNIATDKPDMSFERTSCVAAQTTLYDMQVDPVNRNVFTACQDRQIRIYNAQTTKFKKSIKGAVGDDGNLIKLTMDPSGTYLATSCTGDKTVCIISVRSGDCVAAIAGHSEYVTGIAFCPNFRHLVTVSGDGCIFVWRLSGELTKNMMRRYADLIAVKAQKMGLNLNIPHLSGLHSINDFDDDHCDDDTDSTADTDPPFGQSVAEVHGLQSSLLDAPVPQMTSSPAYPGVGAGNTNVAMGPLEITGQSLQVQNGERSRRQWTEESGNMPNFDVAGPMSLEHISIGNVKRRSEWFEKQRERQSPNSTEASNADHLRADNSINASKIDNIDSASSISRGTADGQSESSPDQLIGSPGPGLKSVTAQIAKLIGRINESDINDDDDGQGTVTDSPVILVPETPDRLVSQFEVKERSAEVLKAGGPSVGGNSRRNSGLAAEFSDEEDSTMSTSSSFHNIRALNQSQETLHVRRQWDLEKAFEIEDERPPADVSKFHSDQAFHSPGSGDSNNQQGGEFFKRNLSDQRRQSLTQKYLKNHLMNQNSPVAPLRKTWESGAQRNDRTGTPIANLELDHQLSPSRSGTNTTSPAVSSHRSDHFMGYIASSEPSSSRSEIDLSGRATWKPPVPERGRHGRVHGEMGSRTGLDRPNALSLTVNSDKLAATPPRQLSALNSSQPNGSTVKFGEVSGTFGDVDSPVDNRLLASRAKSLKNLARNKQRRLTLPSVFSPELMDEDYSSSNLHIRSKSPASSTHRAFYANSENRRESADSDAGFQSGTLYGRAESRGNLHSTPHATPTGGRARSSSGIHRGYGENQVVKKMSDIRERLRKSQENLALAPETSEILHSESAYSGLSRSKSYGSLLSGPLDSGATTPTYQPYSTLRSSRQSTPQPGGGLIGTLERSRALAKSLGSLHGARDPGAPRPLGETLRDIKRISNSDLRSVGALTPRGDRSLQTEPWDTNPTANDLGTFYDKAGTLPRGGLRGPVAKRVADARRSGLDRASVSGDSDSNSDVTGISSRRSAPYTRRYFAGKTGKLSSGAEDFTPPLRAKNTRYESSPTVRGVRNTPDAYYKHRTYEQKSQQLPNSALPSLPGVQQKASENPYRRSSYLTQKMLMGEEVQPGPEQIPDSGSDSISMLSGFSEKMTKHWGECFDQMQTSVDRALQAYKLVVAEKDLSDEERDKLRSSMFGDLKAIHERLGHTLAFGERADPDGGHDERHSGALSPLNQGTNQHQQHVTSPSLPTDAAGQFLQQYSDMLVQMVQKQLQNQK